jgi:hypothetical protein
VGEQVFQDQLRAELDEVHRKLAVLEQRGAGGSGPGEFIGDVAEEFQSEEDAGEVSQDKDDGEPVYQDARIEEGAPIPSHEGAMQEGAPDRGALPGSTSRLHSVGGKKGGAYDEGEKRGGARDEVGSPKIPTQTRSRGKQNQSGFQEMFRQLEGEFDSLVSVVQTLQHDLHKMGGRTDGIVVRLKKAEECTAALLAASPDATPPDSPADPDMDEAGVNQEGTEGTEVEAPQGEFPASGRVTLPPLPDLLSDRHPADLSHLLDPGSGGDTPLPFVSRRGLQKAVEALTDNFRGWLDAIYKSILTALQNKADSTQLDEISRQVQESAGRASDAVASFARRALGGHCASCDAPLADESLFWKCPHPATSAGPWKPRSSAGAFHSIRPPASSHMLSGGKGPTLGPSKLPKLQDLRGSTKDFPKGKVLKSASSDPQLRLHVS